LTSKSYPVPDGEPDEVEYVPRFDKQIKVNEAAPHCRLLFVGGVGFGKTLSMGDFVLEECMNYPDGQMMVAGATIPAMEAATIKKLLENFRERNVWYEYKSYKQTVHFSNGTWFRFQSLDVPQKELEGSELHALAIDEITSCPRKQVFSLLNRVRRQSPVAREYQLQKIIHGEDNLDGHDEGVIRPGDPGWWDYSRRVLFAGNPPEPGHWLEKEYIPVEEDAPVLGDYIAASTYENKLLTKDYIANLEKQYPPGTHLHRRMMLGEFGVPMEGAVYAEYNPKRHLITADQLPFDPNGEEQIVMWVNGLDLGHGKQDAFVYLIGALSNRNTIYIVDEYYSTEPKVMQQHARSIRSKHRGGAIWSDWSTRDRMELAALGIKTLPANKDIAMGIHSVRARFATDKIKIVRSRCPNLLREMSAYEWGPDDKPKKGTEGDHAMDAMRYMVAGIDLPRYRK
jgi:phage terminase large subunit